MSFIQFIIDDVLYGNLIVNAPKSGLFAIVLIISFILHSLLFMMAGNDVLKQNHTQQAQLLMKQLSAESAELLENENFVALALLAERYSTLPSVASLQLYDEQEKQIISAGSHKTQTLHLVTHDVKYNDKLVGHIELSLHENSSSEIFNVLWWAILVSFFLHLVLWAIYVIVIRPRRSEYMQHLIKEENIRKEIQSLKQELASERQHITQILSEYEIHQQQPQTPTDENYLVMAIKFDDPDRLFHRLAPHLAQRYFQTCQTLLQHSVLAGCEQYHIASEEVVMLNHFDENGAKICIADHIPHATECLLLINTLCSSLFDTLHKTYLNNKHFTRPICSAIAENSATEDAEQNAERLLQHLKPQQQAIYLKIEHLKLITTQYQLTAFDNPSNSLIRQSYRITGLNAEIADKVNLLRTQILHTPQ